MKRNIKYPSGRREEAVGASLCLQDTQPILELRDEITVSLAGFSRHREKVSVFRTESADFYPNLGGTADFMQFALS